MIGELQGGNGIQLLVIILQWSPDQLIGEVARDVEEIVVGFGPSIEPRPI